MMGPRGNPVSRAGRFFATDEGLAEIKTYADAIGPWKVYIIPTTGSAGTVKPPTDLIERAHAHGRRSIRGPSATTRSRPATPGGPSRIYLAFYRLGIDGDFPRAGRAGDLQKATLYQRQDRGESDDDDHAHAKRAVRAAGRCGRRPAGHLPRSRPRSARPAPGHVATRGGARPQDGEQQDALGGAPSSGPRGRRPHAGAGLPLRARGTRASRGDSGPRVAHGGSSEPRLVRAGGCSFVAPRAIRHVPSRGVITRTPSEGGAVTRSAPCTSGAPQRPPRHVRGDVAEDLGQVGLGAVVDGADEVHGER